ncbi:MAG: amidohydrolase family protein [Actinomycetales bacterium]|nr:amidohydrolase family protein [Actinomycetales bacterium]
MALELRGTVVLGDERETDRAWVLGDRITLERPAHVDHVIEGVVLPGLVDVHCHVGLAADGPVDRPTARAQALVDRDSGVLLVRDAGSPSDTAWVHDDADLPRLLRAGHHLARPKRYLRHYGRELDSPDELAGAMAQEAARGDGWVKIVADWIDRDLGADGDLRPLWTDTQLAQGMAAAHAAGARVTAHAFSTEALPGLLAAGIDCIEHGTGLTPELIDEVARRGIPVTPTLLQISQFDQIAAQGEAKFPLFAARMRHLYERRYTQVREMFDAGVRLLVGTDAGGTIEHGQIAAECAELVRAGVPAREVVAAASWRTREYLGFASIAEGAPADVVVYGTDPREDVRALGAPSAVVLRGAVHTRA